LDARPDDQLEWRGVGGGNGVFLAEAGATLSFANVIEVDSELTRRRMDTFATVRLP